VVDRLQSKKGTGDGPKLSFQETRIGKANPWRKQRKKNKGKIERPDSNLVIIRETHGGVATSAARAQLRGNQGPKKSLGQNRDRISKKEGTGENFKKKVLPK